LRGEIDTGRTELRSVIERGVVKSISGLRRLCGQFGLLDEIGRARKGRELRRSRLPGPPGKPLGELRP